MQQFAVDTNEEFGKLLEEYRRKNDAVSNLKEKYSNMQSLLNVEEEQIKSKNQQIA